MTVMIFRAVLVPRIPGTTWVPGTRVPRYSESYGVSQGVQFVEGTIVIKEALLLLLQTAYNCNVNDL